MKFRFFISFAVIITALLVFNFSHQIHTNKVDTLNTAALQRNVMAVNFNGKQIEYNYGFTKPALIARSKIVLNALQKIANNDEYNLPIGYYLISLGDRVVQSDTPLLGFAATQQQIEKQQVFLIPDHSALNGYQDLFAALDQSINKYPWESKTPKILWRGSATGSNRSNNDINGSKRLRFLNYVKNLDFVDAGLTSYAPNQHNKEFMHKLTNTFSLKEPKKIEDAIAYKYLIDIDGNSFGYSRIAWVLYSDSLLMKHHFDTVQWYTDQLKPYVHYLPIAEDFSNLQEQYNWAERNPEAAKEIAINGHKLAAQIFNEDNLLRAMEQALIRYNQAVTESADRVALSE